MAPPSSSSSNSNNKGSNPAPDFALFMNKIQMSLDSATSSLPFLQQHRAKAATFIRPNSTPSAQESKAPSSSAGGAFSSLQQQRQTDGANSSTNARPSHRQQDADRLARLAAEEAEFADDRASDANAGVGFARPRGLGLQQQGSARDQDTKALRGRLLGGRRGAHLNSRDEANGSSSYNRRKKYGGGESSDDEPGRSGLGRAKKAATTTITTKRRRSESDEEHNSDTTAAVSEGEPAGELGLPATPLAAASKATSSATGRDSLQIEGDLELVGADTGAGGGQMKGDPNTIAGQGLPEAKLKRKKKKKKKSKQDPVI